MVPTIKIGPNGHAYKLETINEMTSDPKLQDLYSFYDSTIIYAWNFNNDGNSAADRWRPVVKGTSYQRKEFGK